MLRQKLKSLVFSKYSLAPLAFLTAAWWSNTILDNFNSQKTNSHLFKALILQMRHDDKVLNLLGQVEHSGTVKGHVNHIKGNADLEFHVKGSKQDGTVHFVGSRFKNTECWVSSLFTVNSEREGSLDLHQEGLSNTNR